MRPAAVALTALLLAAPAAASAHHSVAAVYDREKAVSLSGRVTRLELINPHSVIEVEFARPDGEIVRWTLETSGPSGLDRQGLNTTTLAIGDRVSAVAYPARSGSREGWLTRLQTPKKTFDMSVRRTSPVPAPSPAS
jgi:hypothetical protein